MSTFYIGAEETAAIEAAVERARQRMIPWDVLRKTAIPNQDSPTVTLADREHVGEEQIDRQSQHVLLPFGYRLSVSCEEQPAGICLHFSLSSPKPGRVPRPEAMVLVLEAAGIKAGLEGRSWLEEFLIDGKPGGVAVNCVVVIAPRPVGGHA